jgi:hypothetical protein
MRTKRWLMGFLALAVLAFSFVLIPGTGAEQKNWRDISTNDLKAMLDRGESLCLVNVLPRIIHDAEYIKGSLNIPIGKIKTSPEMPKDKTKPIVFYCLGLG